MATVGDTQERGTLIRFRPSAKIFRDIQLNYEILARPAGALVLQFSCIDLIDERKNKSDVFKHEGGLQACDVLNRTRTAATNGLLGSRPDGRRR